METESFSLTNPTKDYYDFLGWSGTGLTGYNNTTVTVSKGSTGAREYTANYTPTNYTIAYNNIDGATFATANPTNYDVTSATITLNNPTKDDYIFLGWTYEGQTTPQTTVTINSGSTGNKTYTANWEAKAVASLKSASTDFAVNGQIQIEFDKDIAWQDSYKNHITITPTALTTPITINTYSYSNKVLTLTPASNLKYNTAYTIAIAGIEKVSDKNLTFTTIDLSVTPVITSASTNTVAELEGKTILQPIFTIDFGKAVVNQTIATSSVKLNSNALPNSASFAFDTDGKIATLTFSSNLAVNTSYQLSITGFTDDDNSTINAVNKTFNTLTDDIVGNGTENSPYLIFTEAHLNKVREYVGSDTVHYFKQMDDIVLTGNWLPIGDNTNKFTGYYNGNGKKIKNLTIHSSDYMLNAGLFGVVSNNGNSDSGKIENLTIDGFSLRGSSEGTPLNAYNIGLIACKIESNCSITNCHLTDSSANTATNSQSIISALDPNGEVCVGGICAINSGTISNCSVGKCQIKPIAQSAQVIYLGGICYSNSGSISNCDAEELIIDCSVSELQNHIHIGGICANNSNTSSITNCSVKNTSLTASKGDNGILRLGGICSNNNGSISNSDVQNTSLKGTGKIAYVGGISGYKGNISDSITGCYVKDSVVESEGYQCSVGGIAGGATSITSCHIDNTTVKSNGDSCYIGGISGSSAAISKCYVTNSEITETSDDTSCNIGGISGYNTKNISSAYVINTNIKGSGKSGDYVGGICGRLHYYYEGVPVISNCYVYEDGNHSISKLQDGEGKLGYLVGLLYKNDSNPSSNAKVTDSFCNLTTNSLSDLVNSVGSSGSPSELPDDATYLNEYIKNNYGGVTNLTTFSGKTWSDGAWSDYDTDVFPPTLKP